MPFILLCEASIPARQICQFVMYNQFFCLDLYYTCAYRLHNSLITLEHV